MRRNALILTLVAISLVLISTAALSQPYGQRAERSYSRHYDSSQGRHANAKRHDRHERNRRHEQRKEQRKERRDKHDHLASPHHDGRAHAWREHPSRQARNDSMPTYRFHRGDSLPHSYRHHRHVVHHWHHHHLRHPPHGHHWVHIDGDYLLIAIATGVIVDILITR